MIPLALGIGWLAKGLALSVALPRLARALGKVPTEAAPVAKPAPEQGARAFSLSGWKPIVFTYDNLGQLIGVNLNQQPNSNYTFDPSGNLLSMAVNGTTSTFTYNSLNQPTTPGTNVFDTKGQTTDQNGRQYEWDDDGRCTAVIVGTARSEFSYDGYGRRVRIVEKNGATVTSDKKYFWIGGSIVTERDALQAGAPITKRYFGQGVIANGTKLFYTFGHLGSVRELVDDTGAVRADYRYDTYGTRTKVSGDLDADYGYAGLFHHTPTGLDLATYRIYDSTQHRWLSRDPLGEGVDLNLYRYCGNDPIGRVDPQGLGDDPYILELTQETLDLMKSIFDVPGGKGGVGIGGVPGGIFILNQGKDKYALIKNPLMRTISGGSRYMGGAVTAETLVGTGLGAVVFVLTYGNVANCRCQNAIDRYIQRVVASGGRDAHESEEYIEMMTLCDVPGVFRGSRDYVKGL